MCVQIVEDADRHVTVMYGSDIDSTTHGSGFATDLCDPYSRFGWNLNVLPGLPESILNHVSGISGARRGGCNVALLFMKMRCFSCGLALLWHSRGLSMDAPPRTHRERERTHNGHN